MSILRPDRMHFLRLVLLKDDLPAVFSLLLKRDVIHIEKASNFFGHESSYTPVQTHSAQADMLALKQNLKEGAAALKINPKHRTGLAPDRIPLINPLEYTSIIQPELADLMQQVKPLWHAINTGRARAKQLEVFSRIMVMLEERNLDPQMIRKGTFSEFEVGLIPSDALDTLKSGLSNIPHCLEHSPYSQGGTQTIVCLGVLKKHRATLRKIFKAIQFEPVSVPPRSFTGREQVEGELHKVLEQLAQAETDLADLKKSEAVRLREWWHDCAINLRVLEVMERFLQSKAGYFLVAWVPSKTVEDLEREIIEALNGQVWIDAVAAKEVLEVKEERVTVPTLLDHPWWLRPFKLLVELYGQPAYHCLDPTLLFALSFVIMFGMMFGDIGHGGVLALVGLWLYLLRKSYPFFEYFGIVLIYCGISSIFFGVLYGSVFGYEHLIETVWFNPLQEPLKGLRIGIELGVVLLSVALLFNLVQCWLAGQFRKGLFGQWGLASTLFYWGAIIFALDVTSEAGRSIPYWGVVLLLGLPLLAVTAGDYLFWKWTTGSSHHRPGDYEISPETAGNTKGESRPAPGEENEKPELAETLFKPVEIVMGLLANTVSFIRVAAFAMNHTALMLAVFEIQSLCGKGLISTGLGLLVGNLAVVVLEGIVVFIQCMRLEYYEIFSKIFMETGRKFEPLSQS